MWSVFWVRVFNDPLTTSTLRVLQAQNPFEPIGEAGDQRKRNGDQYCQPGRNRREHVDQLAGGQNRV